MMNYDPVKIVIVGCGAITKKQHLPAALRSPKIDIFAMVDSSSENAEELTRKFSLSCNISIYLNEVIEKVDGVLVATPNNTHYHIAEIALKRGVPVLIEKPITTNYEDAIKLCDLAQKNNTFISVGYHTRHYPSVILLKRLLDVNYFGKINHFYYEYGTIGGWAPLSGYNIDRQMSGGGVLVVSGTHFLDRILFCFGEPKEIIYKDDSYGGVEANCKGELFFKNELGSFSGTFFMSKTVTLKNRLILDTEKYLCELGESNAEKISLIPKDDLKIRMELSPNIKHVTQKSKNYYQIQLEEFADNIRKHSKITVDGWFAARSVKLIEKMYKNRVQLDEPWLLYKSKIKNEQF